MSLEIPFQKFCEKLMLTSASLFVYDNGNEEFLNYGVNPSSSHAITSKSIFDIASVTKVFTTTAFLQCLERGFCGLDDTVQKYLPEVIRSDMTLRDLLTHTARTDIYLSRIREATTDAVQFKKAIFEAGVMSDKEYFYQCQNFMMLGWIIEKVSGMGLDVFMKKNIFIPLGMQDTSFGPIGSELAVPTLCDAENGGFLQGVVHDPNARLLGGSVGNAGIFTTTEDMATFMKMWLHKGIFAHTRILKEEIVDLALRKYYENPNGNFAQGLGWKLHTTHVDAPKILENAWMHLGYTGVITLFSVERNLIFVLLANLVYPNDRINPETRRQFREGVRGLLMRVTES